MITEQNGTSAAAWVDWSHIYRGFNPDAISLRITEAWPEQGLELHRIESGSRRLADQRGSAFDEEVRHELASMMATVALLSVVDEESRKHQASVVARLEALLGKQG